MLAYFVPPACVKSAFLLNFHISRFSHAPFTRDQLRTREEGRIDQVVIILLLFKCSIFHLIKNAKCVYPSTSVLLLIHIHPQYLLVIGTTHFLKCPEINIQRFMTILFKNTRPLLITLVTVKIDY